MRFVFGSLLVVALVALYAPRCDANVLETLVPALANKISGLWHADEVEFLGHSCRYSHRPSFYRWELYYKGRMWCPGWAPFSGNSKTRSPSGAVEHATRDFVQKAVNRNLITEEEARIWLEN